MNTTQKSCGWHGSIADFFNANKNDLVNSLKDFVYKSSSDLGVQSQIEAWRDELQLLSRVLGQFRERPESRNWHLIFEFELPRERGRRPDLIVLQPDRIVVIEFKQFKYPTQASIDQVSAYARDIAHYHAPSHELQVVAILALTGGAGNSSQESNVNICYAEGLASLLDHIPRAGVSIDPFDWLNGEYAPLPSLIVAARTIFNNERLPHIRRAASAGIPKAIEVLRSIAVQAESKGERHLILVTGVPGSGKTLLGLQFVYHDGEVGKQSSRDAVLLSGNGPLVKVLQHALRNKIFVQDVHGFLNTYGGNSTRKPSEHIFVYDEAQRAWDAKRVLEKRGHDRSEAADFVEIGDRLGRWAVLVGLIGEGQEIHLGEEGGLRQWPDALELSQNVWKVHGPGRVREHFSNCNFETIDLLDLNVTLRSHIAADVHKWVAALLGADLEGARMISQNISSQGYDLYLTQSLDRAKEYVQERYVGQLDKRWGLLGSSKAKILNQFGLRTDYSFTKNFREGQWYNDPIDSPHSCCQLQEVATEFACQGLELDMPIVGWGDDLLWRDSAWQTKASPRSTARDPRQLRINSYRVLLSRGRDGMIIFVPPDGMFEGTVNALMAAGASSLT